MVRTTRAQPALDCGSSSYRFPKLIPSLAPPGPRAERGKAVAAATVLQGATRTVTTRRIDIGNEMDERSTRSLVKKTTNYGIAMQGSLSSPFDKLRAGSASCCRRKSRRTEERALRYPLPETVSAGARVSDRKPYAKRSNLQA